MPAIYMFHASSQVKLKQGTDASKTHTQESMYNACSTRNPSSDTPVNDEAMQSASGAASGCWGSCLQFYYCQA